MIYHLVNIEPGIKLGKFLLVQEIGRGGMGTVWKARDDALDRLAAVKILHPRHRQNEKMIQRFRREPLALSRIRHPGVVRVLTLDETPELIYFAMEFVEGAGLDQFISKEFLLPLKRAMPILCKIADALSEIHRNNIIHRDIKPANIVVEHDDHPVITDFGLAKIDTWTTIAARSGTAALQEFDKQDTPHEKLAGTPAYLAPERWLRREYDHRIDIYSFGIMMYQLLTGILPFDSDDPTVLRNLHLYHPCPPPPPSAGTIPTPVLQIIHRCLQKSPDLRFQSAAELRDALRRTIEKLEEPKITPTTTIPTALPRAAVSSDIQPLVRIIRPISFLLLAVILIVCIFIIPTILLKKLSTTISDKKNLTVKTSRLDEGILLDQKFNDALLNQRFRVSGTVEDFTAYPNGTWLFVNANGKRINIWTPAHLISISKKARIYASGTLLKQKEKNRVIYYLLVDKKNLEFRGDK